jgi:hypothetical protein
MPTENRRASGRRLFFSDAGTEGDPPTNRRRGGTSERRGKRERDSRGVSVCVHVGGGGGGGLVCERAQVSGRHVSRRVPVGNGVGAPGWELGERRLRGEQRPWRRYGRWR